MADVWYYSDKNGRVGPFTLKELKGTLASISNARDLFVWRDGFKDWQRVSNVPELSAEAIVPPPLNSTKNQLAASRLRIKLISGALLAVGVVGWIIWPYYAVYDLANAVREGDISILESRVVWDSVRQGLRGDLNAALLQHLSTDARSKTDESGAALGAGLALVLGPAILDRLIDSYVTPQAIAAVNRNRSIDASPTEVGGPPKTFTDAVQAARKIRWDQVRYAFFSGGPLTFRIDILPDVDPPTEKTATLLFKWSGDWKLTRVLLPTDAFSRDNRGLISSTQLPVNRTPDSLLQNKSKTSTFRYGDVVVKVDSEPTDDGTNLRVPVVKGFYQDHLIFSIPFKHAASEEPSADVNFTRLDPTTRLPQVVATSFSGGAHCCTITTIATIDSLGDWHVVDGGELDGDGYQFTDLDGDGGNLLISIDNSFLYAFEAYSGSYAPTRIKKLVGTNLIDVTQDPKYQSFQRQKLQQMEAAARSSTDLLNSNGYLAGWVAEKSLVGELDDAWRMMVASYNRNSNWVLEECLIGAALDKCPAEQIRQLDFPEALAKHLAKNGYVTPDQSRRLIELARKVSNAGALRPSFDCAKAAVAIERTICADPELAWWDGRMGQSFKRNYALIESNQDRSAFLENQRRWIATRNAQCDLPNLISAKSCILQLTKTRVATLDASATSPFPHGKR